jgi:hypothetical protein
VPPPAPPRRSSLLPLGLAALAVVASLGFLVCQLMPHPEPPPPPAPVAARPRTVDTRRARAAIQKLSQLRLLDAGAPALAETPAAAVPRELMQKKLKGLSLRRCFNEPLQPGQHRDLVFRLQVQTLGADLHFGEPELISIGDLDQDEVYCLTQLIREEPATLGRQGAALAPYSGTVDVPVTVTSGD